MLMRTRSAHGQRREHPLRARLPFKCVLARTFLFALFTFLCLFWHASSGTSWPLVLARYAGIYIPMLADLLIKARASSAGTGASPAGTKASSAGTKASPAATGATPAVYGGVPKLDGIGVGNGCVGSEVGASLLAKRFAGAPLPFATPICHANSSDYPSTNGLKLA